MRFRLNALRPFGLSAALFSALAIVELRSVLIDCGTKSVAKFGDGYSTIWAAGVSTKQNFPFWHLTTDKVSSPYGESFWTFDWFSSTLIRIPLYLISDLVGPICGYNLMVFCGLIFTSMSTWWLCYWLSKNMFVSLAAGFLIGFGPFTQRAMTGHLNYMFIGVYSISIYLFLVLFTRITYHRSIVVGLVLGSFSYFDGYFFPPIFLGLSLVLLYSALMNLKKNKSQHSFLGISLTCLMYLGTHLPMMFLSIFWPKTHNTITQRTFEELNVYALKFWYFLLPDNSNVFLNQSIKNWQTNNLGGSNFSETGLFVGYTFIVAILVGVITWNKSLFIGRYRAGKGPSLKNLKLLVIISLFGVLISAKPWITLGESKFPIPLPSGLLYSIYPVWRTISRWGIITTIALVTIGAIFLSYFLYSRSRRSKALIYGVISLSICLDLSLPSILNPDISDVIKKGTAYDWLAANSQKSDTYLDVTPFSVDGFFIGMNLTAQRSVANSLRAPKFDFQQEMLYPDIEEYRCSVALSKAEYLILHPKFYNGGVALDSKYFHFIKSFTTSRSDYFTPWFDSILYKSNFSPVHLYKVEYGDEFILSRVEPKVVNWVTKSTSSNIKIQSVQRSSSPLPPQLKLRSSQGTLRVNIEESGSIVWSGLVKENWMNIELQDLSKLKYNLALQVESGDRPFELQTLVSNKCD